MDDASPDDAQCPRGRRYSTKETNCNYNFEHLLSQIAHLSQAQSSLYAHFQVQQGLGPIVHILA